MTNEELDKARAKEAQRLFLEGSDESPTILIAARLAREGWTPPVAVDPDLLELETLWLKYADGKINSLSDTVLAGIKRGRALAAEARPGMVWVKHDGSGKCPVDPNQRVCVLPPSGEAVVGKAAWAAWETITHYAVITPPNDVA